MNKIIVNEDNLTITNNVVWLDINVEKLALTIIGKVIINELTTTDHPINLTINLAKNSYLIYNRFNNYQSSDIINLNGNENTIINFNYAFIATTKRNTLINYDQKYSHSKCAINALALARDAASITIDASGHIYADTIENEYLENIRILTLNDVKHTILPNLLIDTDNVLASHNATISSIDKDALFYLNAKGLTNEAATKLITNGFLLSTFANLEYQDTIRNLIDKEV